MGSRLALMNVSAPAKGPWTSAKGNESGVRIVHLMEGEHIRLHMKIGELNESFIFDAPGMFPLPWARMDRYMVEKLVDEGVKPSPTHVEILLDGLAASFHRDSDHPQRDLSKQHLGEPSVADVSESGL